MCADPKHDTTMMVDGRKVIVPQGKPVRQPLYKDSNFSESEYLIYHEDQCRIRYLLKLKFWQRGNVLSAYRQSTAVNEHKFLQELCNDVD